MPEWVGRYQLLEPLGQGAMGRVYLAFDPALDRQVALKTLILPGHGRERFRREVQVAARLNHPHIVTIYDVGLEHEPPYVVMELLTGGTLERYLQQRQQRLEWAAALALLHPLCLALAHAHQAGVVHRDVKPANVLFTGGAEQTLKLADFGLARRQGSEQLTSSGAVMGTLAYMSPEQANGREADAASDLFALGVILFEAIAGFNPLRGETWSETLGKVASYDPVDLSPLDGRAPAAVLAIVHKALAKERHERYGSARLLAQELTLALGQAVGPDLSLTLTAATLGGQPDVQIEEAAGLSLPPGGEAILRTMFAGFGRLTLKAELRGGRSGSRIFLVRPIRRDGTAELPAVVKMAPSYLVRQEWRAYQDYVRAQLAGIAEIQGEPVLAPGPAGAVWGGLRYPLVGGGDFEIESLDHYSRRANPADLHYLLEQRLFRRMREKWRHNFAMAEFRLEESYDPVLPVNLVIQPAEPPADTTLGLIRPGDYRGAESWQAGDYVQLRGFVVTEMDVGEQAVTLNRPTGNQPRYYPSYRLRLQPAAGIEEQFQIGQPVEMQGLIMATRHDLLLAQAQAALGDGVDLNRDVLPNGWPNPLAQLPLLLAQTLSVRTANLHGDFNMENILVDPAAREVYLIDFALARRDHVLHDLLRLEKDVVTRLLPVALVEAGLPPQTIETVYQAVDKAVARNRPVSLAQFGLSPALERPLTMLVLIRKTARDLLFDPHDWREYEIGLTLYLLGALKFKDLDGRARKLAFWGAAALQSRLLTGMPATYPADLPPSTAMPTLPNRRPWSRPVFFFLPIVVALLALLAWRVGFFEYSQPAGPPAATLISFTPPVEVRQGDAGRLQPATVGMDLYEGDAVITYAGAMARVFCNGGLLFELPAENVLLINCQNQDSPWLIARVEPEPEPICQAASTDAAATPAGSQANAPLLLSPRNSCIAETRPTFRWQPVSGAARYRLTVNLAGGESWSRETEATSLPYPADAPPLRPGSQNQVTIELIGENTGKDSSSLQVLDTARSAALAVDEAAIEALGLDETAQAYLLARLYQQHGLLAAAIEQLERRAAGPDGAAPYLWRQLGDLYTAVGLSAQAEASYQAALLAAATTPTAIAQATNTPQPTASPTAVPATLTATPTPLPTATLTLVPAAALDLTLPVLVGTAVPQPVAIMGPANAPQVVALGRLDRAQLSEVACPGQGHRLAVATATGVYLYDSRWLVEEQFLPVPVQVNSVAFSPDGQMVAAGSADQRIRLWQVEDSRLLDSWVGHTDRVWSVAFAADGQTVASGSLDGTVRLWPVDGDRPVTTLSGHNGPVRSVAFAPDGQTVASGSDDGTVRLWSVADGTLWHRLSGHSAGVRSVAFAPDGQTVASGSDDGTIRLWQVADGLPIHTLEGHRRAVYSIAFSPDGGMLASASADTDIRLWRAAGGHFLHTLTEPAGWVVSLAFCSDGRLLLSGSSDGAVYLWGMGPAND